MGAAPPFRIRWHSAGAILLILGLAVDGFVERAWVLGLFELGIIALLVFGLWVNHRTYRAALLRLDGLRAQIEQMMDAEDVG